MPEAELQQYREDGASWDFLALRDDMRIMREKRPRYQEMQEFKWELEMPWMRWIRVARRE
eukprot:1012563-Amphidinium_carterae.4